MKIGVPLILAEDANIRKNTASFSLQDIAAKRAAPTQVVDFLIFFDGSRWKLGFAGGWNPFGIFANHRDCSSRQRLRAHHKHKKAGTPRNHVPAPRTHATDASIPKQNEKKKKKMKTKRNHPSRPMILYTVHDELPRKSTASTVRSPIRIQDSGGRLIRFPPS